MLRRFIAMVLCWVPIASVAFAAKAFAETGRQVPKDIKSSTKSSHGGATSYGS